MLKTHITNAYGEATYKQTTKLQQMKRQAARTKCRWIFMSRCVTNNVLPKSFKTKPVLRTRKGFTLTREYNRKMLQATRDDAKNRYHNHLNNIRTNEEQLATQLTTEDLTTIKNITEKSRENKYLKESARLKEKFEGLQRNVTQTLPTNVKKIQR